MVDERVKIVHDLTVEEYNNLREQVGWDVKNPMVVANAIKNSTIVKKALYDNRTVGMARAIGDGMTYLLVDVVVAAEYQKKGIGKRLVNSIIEEVKENTVAGEYSTINLISVRDMEKFYEGCGFEVVPFGYNGSGMRMRVKR